MTAKRPTLAQIRRDWPPTVDVTRAAQALGVGRATLYDALARGERPVKVITVGRRMKVLTHSLLEVLGDRSAGMVLAMAPVPGPDRKVADSRITPEPPRIRDEEPPPRPIAAWPTYLGALPCPACDREVLVRKDGHLRAHRQDGQACPGSGAAVVAVIASGGPEAA